MSEGNPVRFGLQVAPRFADTRARLPAPEQQQVSA